MPFATLRKIGEHLSNVNRVIRQLPTTKENEAKLAEVREHLEKLVTATFNHQKVLKAGQAALHAANVETTAQKARADRLAEDNKLLKEKIEKWEKSALTGDVRSPAHEAMLALEKQVPNLQKREALKELYGYMLEKQIIPKETPITSLIGQRLQAPKKSGIAKLFSREFWLAPIDIAKTPEKALKFLKTQPGGGASAKELEEIRDVMAEHNIGGITKETSVGQLRKITVQTSGKKGMTKLFSREFWLAPISIGKTPQKALNHLKKAYAVEDLHGYLVRRYGEDYNKILIGGKYIQGGKNRYDVKNSDDALILVEAIKRGFERGDSLEQILGEP